MMEPIEKVTQSTDFILKEFGKQLVDFSFDVRYSLDSRSIEIYFQHSDLPTYIHFIDVGDVGYDDTDRGYYSDLRTFMKEIADEHFPKGESQS